MEQNKKLSLQFAIISGKKVTADFTGGDVTSDVGVLVMRETANKIGIIEKLAKVIHDKRHQSYVKHEITELLMPQFHSKLFPAHASQRCICYNAYTQRKSARLYLSCQCSV